MSRRMDPCGCHLGSLSIMAAQDELRDVVVGLEKLDFHHTFTPYDVQEQFMKTVYNVLEAGDGQVGIIESPTGTVSISIIG